MLGCRWMSAVYITPAGPGQWSDMGYFLQLAFGVEGWSKCKPSEPVYIISIKLSHCSFDSPLLPSILRDTQTVILPSLTISLIVLILLSTASFAIYTQISIPCSSQAAYTQNSPPSASSLPSPPRHSPPQSSAAQTQTCTSCTSPPPHLRPRTRHSGYASHPPARNQPRFAPSARCHPIAIPLTNKQEPPHLSLR
jgi:hypothetical protein